MLVLRPANFMLSVFFFSGSILLFSTTFVDPPLIAAPVESSTENAADEKATFFHEKVMPLLESRCFECHGPDSEFKGDLNLSSRTTALTGGETGPAVVPEDPDESLLMQAVRYEGLEMPPRSRMPDEEIEILRQWIADGAVWPDDGEPKPAAKPKDAFPLQERIASHWAWKKIERPAIPEVKQTDWPASDTDRLLLAKMEEVGITPAVDADRRALLRRMYFDVIGLPPTIEQQDRFYNDPAPTPVAMEKVVDELLASPQYGERWARHWLDLVRYAETLGHEFDYPLPYAWRYRDYVIRALNADVPYNEFIREHIAGDLTTKPRRNPELGFNESIIATGFWFLGEDKHAPVDVKGEEASRIDNQIDVFGKTFLGLTIACARCHDHKFDAITTDDYYALSGFLQSSRRRVEWLDSHDETTKLIIQLDHDRAAAVKALNDGVERLRVDIREDLLLKAMGESAGSDGEIVNDENVAKIRQHLLEPKSKNLSNPLSLFATLMQKPVEKADAVVIKEWLTSREKDTVVAGTLSVKASTGSDDRESAVTSSLYADMHKGLPDGWRAFGAAFHSTIPRTSRELWSAFSGGGDVVGGSVGGFGGGGAWGGDTAGNRGGGMSGGDSGPRHDALVSKKHWSRALLRELKWFNPDSEPDGAGCVTSVALSPKLRGQLHSPEFVLTHPEIQILAAGKDARVRLVIDGYVMNEFSELLFGGCRQPINTDGEFRWIRIAGDVKRYIGHRCHLEFLDDGDGWFAVREVRLMAQPAETPVPRPEIAYTNARLRPVPEHGDRRNLVREWAKLAADDNAWSDVVVKLRLIPEPEQAALDKACAAWKKAAEQPQPGDPVLVMCEGTGEDEYVFIRGNHNNQGPIARRHMLTALDHSEPLKNPEGSGRMELVDRVLADSNPFPARVAVNRVWQHLFGRGIVASSDNFGVLGEKPTHPELLDLLADDFRKDGWSHKRLIKRLMLTRAYRLSSQRSELAEQQDPTNKLLHRFSVRRLEGEVIRDSMLAISGRLDSTMYGPSVPVYLSSFMEGRGRPGNSGPLDGAGRRSIYQGVNRNFLNPFMLAFDTPQPASAISRRSVSTVPAQSLILLNNEFVHQQAGVWAKHLLAQGMRDDADMIRLAYRFAFAREPSEIELASLLEFVNSGAAAQPSAGNLLQNESLLTDVCHVLLNQKELLFLE